MNTSTFKALTWGTVAAAVLSALLLAVVESGAPDFGRDRAEEAAPGTAQTEPTAAPGARADRSARDTAPR
jgi:hypothetical protein